MIRRFIDIRSTFSIALSLSLSAIILLAAVDHSSTLQLHHWLLGHSQANPIASNLLSIATALIIGLLLRELMIRLKLSETKGCYQPLLLSLIIFTPIRFLHYMDVASTGCVSIAAFLLLSSYNTETVRLQIHRAGIALGAATLLQPQLLWSIPVFWIMMLRLGHRDIRLWGVFLIGMAFPFVVGTTALLLFDQQDLLLSLMDHALQSRTDGMDAIPLIPAMVVLVLSVIGIRQKLLSGPISERALLQTGLLWFVGMALALTAAQLKWSMVVAVLAIPMALFVSIYLENAKRTWIPDVVIISLLTVFLLT